MVDGVQEWPTKLVKLEFVQHQFFGWKATSLLMGGTFDTDTHKRHMDNHLTQLILLFKEKKIIVVAHLTFNKDGNLVP